MRRILRAGDRALLVEEEDLAATMRLHAALSAALADPEPGDPGFDGVEELVPAARTLLVTYRPERISEAELRKRLTSLEGIDAGARDGDAIELPVQYDGQDLEEAASLLHVTPQELITRHQAATWTVAFTGYAPGFGYLAGDDPLFDIPRRSSPRTRIPAGSVGLAGTFSGIYPRESPGGWQLIGRTSTRMWDLDREEPALLIPGRRVRFVEADASASPAGLPSPASAPSTAAARSAGAGPAIEVVRPGLQLTVQDLGRPGHAALGVSASGTADRAALRAANRAVGNDPGTAGLEIAGGGAVLRFHGLAVIALHGAPSDAVLLATTGERHPVLHGTAVAVEDGDELRLGGLRSGLRTLLAIRGGIDLGPALGSRATDTLAGLGPRGVDGPTLQPGEVIPCHGPASAPHAVEDRALTPSRVPASGDEVVLDVVLGPREDWFTADALRVLLEQEWLVTPSSDRVGVRLQGERALSREVEGELPSEGAVTGSLQVPPDGQPVLFLADHPLTGGYPVIGVLADHHLDLAGQLPPGIRLRFRAIDPDPRSTKESS